MLVAVARVRVLPNAITSYATNVDYGCPRAQEDLPERRAPAGESGLHRRSPDLASEPQSAVGPGEVVVTADQFQVLFELFLGRSVGKRSSRQVRQALPDGQIQALDERGVQCRRVFRVFERFFETPPGS